MEAAREEVKIIKEQEEQAMREALGLAPKRASRPQGNRLDKHEFAELVKRGSTAEDLGAGHAEAAHVQGLGFSRAPRPLEETSSLQPAKDDVPPEGENVAMPDQLPSNTREKESEDESSRKKRRREERKKEKQERREKRHSRDSDDKRKRRKDKEKRRHDSDSD
ncbi:hypothetical protein CJ030_MR1G019295 [Morella rubra]|uniref:Uncharacterized protein n=1 Tax=Morella rubra TaxID=262757 RepID=A0A6A1WL03_9ROSI|nr:hypothetical protein CJ030_MR1G019295 [Morella rubra]